MAHVAFKANIGKVRGLQFSNDGKPRFSFSAAESHRRFNKQTNQWEDTGTTWWSVTVFGKQAEDLADVIAEGKKQQVTISGRSETREYEHNGEKRTSLDVIADHVGLVHRAPSNGQPGGAPNSSSVSGVNAAQAAGFGANPNNASDPWTGGQQQGNGWDAPQQTEAPF